jgi:Type II restriction endonuclease, TdeIII
MDFQTRQKIKGLVTRKIQEKLRAYAPESSYTPFFEAMFDKGTIVQASIMHSLYTSFGMSIYEQIAVLLAEAAGYSAFRQYRLLGSIDSNTESLITIICAGTSQKSDKLSEIERIRESVKPGQANQDNESVVDVFVCRPAGEEIYIDITTVKPNLKEFRALRKKMLRWCALRFSQDKEAQVNTYIGIPYNPYYPNSYARWTSNECDVKYDLRIQEDLWREFAGYDVFNEIIDVFQEVGEELKAQIAKFVQNKY